MTTKAVYHHIAQITNNPIIQRRTCQRTGEQFPIYQSEREMLDAISPTINGKRYTIPSPSLSPRARNIHRMLFRNDRVFYKAHSDHDNKAMISIYHPDFPGTQYEVNQRYQDFRDPMSYAIDYQPGDNILTAMTQLTQAIPRLNVDGLGNTNSDYCNYCGYCTDCYMDIAGENNQSCYYCLFTKYSINCVDCSFVYQSQRCYESISCYACNKIVHSHYLENCSDCYFSFDLKNCHHCLRCHNLRNASYCIRNQQVSKQEYEQTINSLINGSHQAYQSALEQFHTARQQFIYPALYMINAHDSCGNNTKDTGGSSFLFNASEVQDSMYCYDVLHAKNCLDLNYSLYHPEQSYQLMSTLELKQSVCNVATHHSHHVYYCQLCNNSDHLFGCIGLNNKSYCIFNKQYTKADYFTHLATILDTMIQDQTRGRYFDPSLSPHPYNDTVAQEYYPVDDHIEILQPEKAVSDALLDLGGEHKIPIKRRTTQEEVTIPSNTQTIHAADLPDSLTEQTAAQLGNQAIICSSSKRPFRIVKPELTFYHTMRLPIPRKHFEIRHLDRVAMRPNREFQLRTCDTTGEQILSVYPPNTPFQVYSQAAYEKAVYG